MLLDCFHFIAYVIDYNIFPHNECFSLVRAETQRRNSASILEQFLILPSKKARKMLSKQSIVV